MNSLSQDKQDVKQEGVMKQASDVIWRPAPMNCPKCNHSITPRSTGNGREVECPGCGHRWTEE